MWAQIRGATPFLTLAIFSGAAASFLPIQATVLVVGLLALWLTVALMTARSVVGNAWHPAVMLLTAFAVVSVTFNGVPLGFTNASDVLLVAALAAVGICWLQGTLELPAPAWLLGAAGLLIAGVIVATIGVPTPPIDPPPSFTPIQSTPLAVSKAILGLLAVPLLIGAVGSSWRRVNLLADLWVASAFVSCAVAVFDAVSGMGIGRSITGGELFEASRQGGLALHPNHLALSTVMALPVALHRIVHPNRFGSATWAAAAVVLIGGVLVSGSRVNLIALFVAVGLTAALLARLRAGVVATGVAVAIVTLIVLSLVPHLTQQFAGIDRLGGGGNANLSTAERSVQVQQSLHIALDHPITGVGFSVITDAHNLPVQYWEAAGLLGLLSLVFYATGTIQAGMRLYLNARTPRDFADLAGALTVSFCIYVMSGLFQSQLGDRYIYVPVGLLVGLQVAASKLNPKPSDEGAPDPGNSAKTHLLAVAPPAAARFHVAR